MCILRIGLVVMVAGTWGLRNTQGAEPAVAAVTAGSRAAVPVERIVVDPAADAVEKAAAKELQSYLARMGGGTVPVVESADPAVATPGTICVGRGEVSASLCPPATLDQLGPDGFVLRAQDGRLVAVGRNHRGTAYAVYRLLERLGCRFYARDLEVVPTAAAVTVPEDFEVTDNAAFEWRAMQGTIAPMKCTLSPGEWEATVADVDVPKMMAFPPGGFWHHTMGFLLPAKPLAETHPDYLAQIGGQRRVSEPAVQQYCLSNPELLALMTDQVLAWIASDPDKDYYPVHYGDVVSFCECDKCKAMYAEKGSITDAVIWFDNQIAKAVAAKYPDKYVTILAYHSTRTPPKKVKPEPNLLIIFCAIVECQARPWAHPVNVQRRVLQDLEGWIGLHPLGPQGIITFEYPTTYNYSGFTYPALYAFVENVREYRRLGLRGVYICGLGGWKHLEHAYSYVIPRILWNPDQDMGTLLDEFCAAWYGSAAKPMRQYIEWLHTSAMQSQSEGVMDCHAGPGQAFFRELYTPEFMQQAYALFAQAEAQAEDDTVRKRIAKEKWGFLFTDLYLHGVRSGEIVPADTPSGIETSPPRQVDFQKVSELLRISRLYNRPWVINPRAWHHYSLSSLVGVEPAGERWWDDPRVRELMDDPARAFRQAEEQHQQRVQRLVTLENDDLQAIIVPTLGGRIWRLYHKGLQVDLLRRSGLPIGGLEKGLPHEPYLSLGGYEEYAGREFGAIGWGQDCTCDVAADGTSATLTAVLENGLKLVRVVSLAADKAEVIVDSRLENTGTQAVQDVVLRVHPEFRPQAGGEMPELLGLSGSGTWETIAYQGGDNALTGSRRPQGGWAVLFPQAGLRVENRFDPAQVETCFFYDGRTFFNLELFSPGRDLEPGASLGIRHRYLVQRIER